jgi:hypothetical protein
MPQKSINNEFNEKVIFTIVAIITVMVTTLIFTTPYGDDVTVYDTVIIGEHYIKPDGFYYKGIVSTSQCGNLMEHMFGSSVREFKVSQDQFQKTFKTHQSKITYTCEKGTFENITWSD